MKELKLLILIWMMYCVVIVYNIVDTLQTIMLLELGAREANPFLEYMINLTGTIYIIGVVKLFPITLLGICLYLHFVSDTAEETNV